ncbi:MAG: hypothetical protein KDD53_10505, partial [Bdellovibrionales bacterium]|nr:hypothetical protein [Bdellovibrionales bacterium]
FLLKLPGNQEAHAIVTESVLFRGPALRERRSLYLVVRSVTNGALSIRFFSCPADFTTLAF